MCQYLLAVMTKVSMSDMRSDVRHAGVGESISVSRITQIVVCHASRLFYPQQKEEKNVVIT